MGCGRDADEFPTVLCLLPWHPQEMSLQTLFFFLKSLFIGDILLMHYSFFQGRDAEDESGEAVCWCSQVHDDLPQTRPWQWREWREVSQEQCSTLHCLGVWVGARHLGAKTGVLWYPEGLWGTALRHHCVQLGFCTRDLPRTDWVMFLRNFQS